MLQAKAMQSGKRHRRHSGPVKILCVSDTVDPLVDSPGIRERFGDVDLVLAAGDLPMDYLSYIVSALNKPLLFVFGNHNLGDLPYYRPGFTASYRSYHDYSRDRGTTHVGFRIRRESGLIVMGFDGSLRYNRGLNQFTQNEMWLRVLARIPVLALNRLFLGRAVDIILTHAPPRGLQDRPDPCHRGFDAFRWLVRVCKPAYLVHGHVHLYDARESRSLRYGSTTILNACGHCVISTGA